jgi:D-tyrosyl-tRNA(Tyr) deacylase
MRAVVQRVSQAAVHINGIEQSTIGKGFMILLGIETEDNREDADWLCKKIFPDEAGLMNNSLSDIDGSVLLVSQFTLHASCRKGNRPSFIRAARPELAIPLYEYFITQLSDSLQKPIATGTFGADMQVSLVNDGPVTILYDTKNKE